MWSMPLALGLGSEVGVISRFGEATARDTAAPAAVAAVPSRSWRRVSGDMRQPFEAGAATGVGQAEKTSVPNDVTPAAAAYPRWPWPSAPPELMPNRSSTVRSNE